MKHKRTKLDLAREVQDLLQFKIGKGKNIENSKAMLIVNTIFNTIAKAIQNGETVKINGFGKFHIVTRPPIKRGYCYFAERPGKPDEAIFMGVKEFPAKRRVAFKTAPALWRYLLDED